MDTDKTIIRPRPRRATAADRTVIRPRPGGERSLPAEPTIIQPRPRRPDAPLSLRAAPSFDRGGLLEAAATLLSLAAQIPQLQGRFDVPQLRAETARAMREFRRMAQAAAVERGAIEQGSYLLCSLIDELVLNADWGEHSSWSQQTLLGEFHNETAGGEKVFVLIEEALALVRKDEQLLELAYLCLGLGFEGRYRIDPHGRGTLEMLRGEIYECLHKARERHSRELSPAAAPEHGISRRLYSFTPVWVGAAVLALAAFALFSALLLNLNERSDRLVLELELAELTPALEAAPARVERPQLLALRQALADEIERGVVQVHSFPNRVSTVLSSGDLFATGSAELSEAYLPVLAKLARVLESVPGQVVVAGHTDSIPIRSARFPSNWHLSLARASAVAGVLGAAGNLSGRLLPEGRAAAEPVADNDSAEGRARNRRIAVDLYFGRGFAVAGAETARTSWPEH